MLKRMAVGLVAMVLVVAAVGIGLVTASRMRAPTAEQQAALDLLESPSPAQGSNAFPALLLMPYDVPADRVEALALAESQRFNRTPVGAGFELRVPYPDLAVGSEQPANCSWRDSGCLHKVRQHRDAYAARLQRQAPLLQRARSLGQHGHYRTLMDQRIDTDFPRFQVLTAATTHHALQFVDGDVESALTGVCGDVQAWRRLAPTADNLLTSMIGSAAIQGSSQLFAEMLESLPAEHPLPPSCATAFVAPAASELSLCEAMRGEAVMSRSISSAGWAEQEQSMTPLQRAWGGVVYDQHKTEARLAPAYAWPCTSQARDMVARDVPALREATPGSRWNFECVGNMAGCILADIAIPAYRKYPQRMQDTGAMVRAVGTLLWMRERRAAGDARPVAELLGTQPEALKSATRPLRLVEEGSMLQVDRFDDTSGKTFQLPLPASVRESPAPAR